MNHLTKSTLRENHTVRVNAQDPNNNAGADDVNGVAPKEPVVHAQKTVVTMQESLVDRLLRETRNKLLRF